jgi:hypothetical protein
MAKPMRGRNVSVARRCNTENATGKVIRIMIGTCAPARTIPWRFPRRVLCAW